MLASADTARNCYLIACIALVICGIIAIVQKSALQGIAWIALAIAILGLYMTITP